LIVRHFRLETYPTRVTGVLPNLSQSVPASSSEGPGPHFVIKFRGLPSSAWNWFLAHVFCILSAVL
jgi:hypothetical protein